RAKQGGTLATKSIRDGGGRGVSGFGGGCFVGHNEGTVGGSNGFSAIDPIQGEDTC
ncbi:MAG: hypothetical protein RL025_454, partial [Bacteroidota bacterium]